MAEQALPRTANRISRRLHALAPVLLLAGSSVYAASPLPLSQWQVETSPGSRLQLEERDGNLLLSANLVPNTVARSGHRVFHYACADLRLRRPLPLSAETERIVYEALDLRQRPSPAQEIRLRPVVRNTQGELFVFEPKPYSHLKSGGLPWSKWMTASFYAGEAGAAATELYVVEGQTGGNAIPDAPLEFIGFKLTLRVYTKADNPQQEKVDPVTAPFALGEFGSIDSRLPYEAPFAYADAFLTKAGEYTIAVRVCNQFQALPIREFKRQIAFDPNNLASRKQKLEIPLGPDDNYWIDYQITDAKGALVAADSLREQVLGNPDKAPCQPVDPTTPPAIGFLRLNLGQSGLGVYERGQPWRMNVRVFPQGQARVALAWDLLACTFDDSFDRGTLDLDFAGKPYLDLVLTPKPQAGRDAYRLRLQVRDGQKLMDEQTYFLGFRSDLAQSHDRAGELPDRREIKKQPYNRTTYLPSNNLKTEAQADAHFREYLRQAGPIASSLTYMIDLRDFEVLPGVFDFTQLDRLMDAAADYGCKVTVRLAHADQKGENLYRWPKYSRQFNYDGTVAPGHPYYGAYAVTDPGMTKLWLDSYRALHDRYRQHTAFEGYYIMQPGGEWTVVDQPWSGEISGYDPASAAGFREYLQKTAGFSLAQLNQRWDTHLSSWEEVVPPLPDLRGGALPDLRLQWLDFNRFKAALGTDVWFPRAIRSIREYDDRRVTIIYGAPSKYRHLEGLLDYGHNGGNHYGNYLGAFIDAWGQGQIGWITEPHHPHRWAAYGDPAQRGWVLDWSVWVMTAQAAGGGANLHIYYFATPSERVAHYGGAFAYDALERYKPILSELHEMKLYVTPAQVAVNQDPYTLYCKHRTTFRARLDDLCRWFELLQSDSVPYVQLEPAKLADYKLVLPNLLDEVIGKENLDLYVKAVQNGASMIVTANTGKYVPEVSREPFQLLKALGIAPPAQPYSGRGAAVTATVDAQNPLFFQADQPLAFQTTDSFRAQLASPAVLKEFWQYPYRWIPETDYFGYYPGHRVTDGQVVARFADGGAAVSLHRVGKGRVVVFWGTPDIGGDKLKGLMTRTADWAGVANPLKDNPLRYVLEGGNETLKRHYLLVYNETPGSHLLKVPHAGDGEWFLDDPISAQRLGRAQGKTLRETGVRLTWQEGYSPLKFIRLIGVKATSADWPARYPQVAPETSAK